LLGTGIVVFGYITPFLLSIFSLMSSCSGEGCWLPIIIMGDLLFLIITPLLFIFIAYLVDTENYPYNLKKVSVIASIIIFVLLANSANALERDARRYASEANSVRLEHKSYTLLKECWESPSRNDCYGYFASTENNVKLCDEYFKDYNADKEYVIAECITSFAINKNNIDYCNDIQYEKYKNKCIAQYYIAKEDYNNCNKVQDDYWGGECLRRLSYKNTSSLIRKYAEFRGFLKEEELRLIPIFSNI